MTDRDLVAELAARARVAPGEVRAVLGALAEVACGHPRPGRPATSGERQAGEAAVERLIADACRHPLGIEFLLEGEPGCVAATFGTHAFTVDAARERLGSSNS